MNSNFPQTWRPPVSAHQSNAFTTAQAIAAGLTKRQVAYRLNAGTLQRVAGKALRHREDLVTPQMLAYAAHLTWPETVLCGPNVAALLGAPLKLSEVHVIATDKRRPIFRLHPHKLRISREECRRWRGITMTSPVRGFIDSLVMLPEQSAKSLFVWAFTRDRLTIADLQKHLDQNPGHRENKRLRSFAENARAGIMSPAEELAHEILKRAGFTGWIANAPVSDWHGIIARVDILFTAQRVVVEIDGRRFHGPERFQSDRTRDNKLMTAGYLVLRFTWADLTKRPHTLVTQLREVLSSR